MFSWAHPQRVAASYLGGTGADDLVAAAFAPDGTIVMIGHLASTTLGGVTPAVLGDTSGTVSRTGFVARLSSDGKTLLSVTRFPWGAAELHRVAVNSNGIYITGYGTNKVANIPGMGNAIGTNTSTNFNDFVIRLNLTASACLSGTFLGGDANTLSEKSKNRTGLALFANGDVAVAHDRGATQAFDYVSRLNSTLNARIWYVWDNYRNAATWGSASGSVMYTQNLAASADEQFLFTIGYIQGNTGLEPYKMPFVFKYKAMPEAGHINPTTKEVSAANVRLLQRTNPNGTLNGLEENRYGFTTPGTYYGLYNFAFRLIGDNRMISDTTGMALAPGANGTMLATLYSDGGASVLNHDPNFPGFTLNGSGLLPSSILGGDSWTGMSGATSVSAVGRLLSDTSNWQRLHRIRGMEDNVGGINPYNRIYGLVEMLNGKVLAVGEGRDVSDVEEWEYGQGAGSLIMKLQVDASGNRREFVSHVPGVSLFRGVARQGTGTRYVVVGTAIADGAPALSAIQSSFAGGTSDGYFIVFDDDDQPATNVQRLVAEADSMVAHQHPDTNYGASTIISAQARTTWDGNTSHTTYNRKMYLRFNLNGLNRQIEEARLQFWLNNPYGQGSFELWGVNEGQDAWDEATLTYNNAPANTPLNNSNDNVWGVDATKAVKLADWTVQNGQMARIVSLYHPNLTQFVRTRATSGNRRITLILVKNVVQIDSFDVLSREAILAEGQIAPTLRLSLGAPLPGGQTYATWAAGIAWRPGDDTSDTGNPDGDSFNNLASYALNLSPIQADSRQNVFSLSTQTDASQTTWLVLEHPYNPSATDIVWEVLAGTSPTAWINAPLDVEVELVDPSGPSPRRRYRAPIPAGDNKRFLGVRVRRATP